ncbi:MAG TPA: DUF2505 family protein [Acidimicrobiales bacterium]|nr:DUF2505 family protein [Acidimicrobiales bacterium]
MRITFDQHVAVSPDAAVAAYGNPAFYEGRPTRDNISVVEVVGREDSGDRILIQVRFTFTGSVSSAVRAVVDPAKMSWITRTEVLLDERRTAWQVLPDHYPDRLTSSGGYRFLPGTAGSDSATIAVEGDLKVHVPIVGRSVERVIVSGLRKYISAEVASLPDVPSG